MKKPWPLLLLFGFSSSTQVYNNSTLDENYGNSQWETEGSCSAGKWGSCIEGGAFASFSAILGKEFRFSKSARLTRMEVPEENEARFFDGESIFTQLARAGDNFVKSAGIEIDLTPDVTENGRYQPRFIDEIYTELDTLELKHAKPNKQYELKKLFIPLLVILKVFKLKLLLLLPIILGLASFKKLIAIAVMLLPAIIAYFKVCKPDLGQSYGSFGHSNFYQTPPSNGHQHYSEDGTAYDRMSYRHHADRLAYNGYRQKLS